MIVTEFRERYTLLLSYNPCDLFSYFGVEEMHGLSLKECQNYENTFEDAYIAGLCNEIPNKNQEYFVYINLQRCKVRNDIHTTACVFHEMMHMAGYKYDGCWDSHEEEMITWAEKETIEVVQIIKPLLAKATKDVIK